MKVFFTSQEEHNHPINFFPIKSAISMSMIEIRVDIFYLQTLINNKIVRMCVRQSVYVIAPTAIY